MDQKAANPTNELMAQAQSRPSTSNESEESVKSSPLKRQKTYDQNHDFRPSTESSSNFDDSDLSDSTTCSSSDLDTKKWLGKRKISDATFTVSDSSNKKLKSLIDHLETPSSGLKHNQHGPDFQLNLLMLVLWRALGAGYSEFRLATELPEAEKFDDVVFQYREKDTSASQLRLIQAKHKEAETISLIDRANLLSTEDDKDFSLQKYFRSFMKIRRRCQQKSFYSPLSGAEIQDITLLTNTDFCSDDLRICFEEGTTNDVTKDVILGCDAVHRARKYRIPNSRSNGLVKQFLPILMNSSDLYKLVNVIANCTIKEGQIDKTNPIVQEYAYPLSRRVFKCMKVEATSEFYLQFSPEFLDGTNQSEEILAFRDTLIKEIGFRKSPPKFHVNNKFGLDELPSDKPTLERLGNKLATSIVKEAELQRSDYATYSRTLTTEVINCSTGRFRNAFINGKNSRLRNFRDILKDEIRRIRNVSRVTNRDLETIQIKISEDFAETSLPNDLDKLDRIAEAFASAFSKNQCLSQSPTYELDLYHSVLAKDVLDISNGRLHDAFVNADISSNSNKATLVAFRRSLVDKVMSETDLGPTEDYLKQAKIPVTKGLAADFQFTTDVRIECSKLFALQFFKILSSQTTPTTRHLEISERAVNLSNDELNIFKTNVRILGEGHVLIEKLSKIRFSTNFIEHDQLMGNLNEFRSELISLLGPNDFRTISEYTFFVDIEGFRAYREEILSQTLPQPYVDTDFQEFFHKLRIIVNYPNRIQLNALLETEMKNKFHNLNSKVLSALYQGNLQSWMSDRIGTFYTAEKARSLFADIERSVLCWPMDGISRSYFSAIPMKYTFETSRDLFHHFLKDNHQQVMQMTYEHLMLGRIRVVQSFLQLQQEDSPETQKYTRRFGYIFFKLTQLRDSSFFKQITKSLADKAQWNLLVIECNCDRKTRRIFDRLKNALLSVTAIRKIILITATQDRFTAGFENDPVFHSKFLLKTLSTNFLNMTDESQNTLLDKGKVSLQKSILHVKQLIDDAAKRLIDADALVKLITGKSVKVGKNLQFPDSYDPSYYIDRLLDMAVEIKDEVQFKCSDVLVVSDSVDEFIEACKEYDVSSNRSVHWLRNMSGRLFWQRTLGKINMLVKYRNMNQEFKFKNGIRTVEAEREPAQFRRLTEKDLLTFNDNQKLMIISNSAGMGKSTILSNLSKLLKKEYSSLWVLRIDLNEYTSFFSQELTNRKARKSTLDARDPSSSVTFLIDLLQSNEKSKLPTNLDINLLADALNRPSLLKLALLFDAFDEISPTYKDIVLDLLLALQSTCVQRLIVTTRPNMQQNLERALGLFACTLREFSKDEQIRFLVKFWKKRMTLKKLSDSFNVSVLDDRLNIYAKALIQKQSDTIQDKHMEFTGIPLQLRLLAEIFEEAQEGDDWQGCRDFILSADSDPALPERLNVFDLYRKFIEKKYLLYRKDKMRQDITNVAAEIESLDSFRTFVKQHQKMALYAIFEKEDLEVLLSSCGNFEDEMEEVEAYINRIERGQEMRGIITQIVNNKPQFIHRTFAEYFVADFLGTALTRRVQQEPLHQFLLEKILPNFMEYKPIRVFFEEWLGNEKDNIPESSKKMFGKSIIHVWLNSEKQMTRFLHRSCEDSFTETVRFICECLKDHTEYLHEIVNSYSNERTMLYYATLADNLDIVKLLVECGADVDASVYGQTVLQAAGSSRKMKVCKWLALPKEEGGPGANIHTMAEFGRTTMDKIIHSGDLELCQGLVARGLPFNSTDEIGRTPLHGAILHGHLHIVQWLISIGADRAACDKYGRNALHYTCMTGKLNILQWLIRSTSEGGGGLDINVKTKKGGTLLHTASTASNFEMFQWLLDYGFEINATDDFGSTPLLIAAYFGHLKVVQWLLNKGADIKVTTNSDESVLHLAARARKPETCEWLLEQGMDSDILTKDKTLPIQLAASSGHLKIVQKLLIGKPPSYGTHQNGDTILHFAASSGNIEICEWLLTNEDMVKAGLHINCPGNNGHRMLHLATKKYLRHVQWLISKKAEIDCRDNAGFSVLHYAAGYGKLDICKWLVKPQQEGGGGMDANVKAKDGSTVLHSAVSSGSLSLCRWLTETVGLQVRDKNGKDQTALDIAEESSHESIIAHLKNVVNKTSQQEEC